MPAVDVFENQDGITLLADMPGVSKDKLDIQVEADTLTIEGEVALDLPQAWRPATSMWTCRATGVCSR